MVRPVSTIVVLLLALLAWTTPAQAQGIRRCVDARGMSIFTDRPCSEMNAVPMQAPPVADGNLAGGFRGGFSQRGCARRPEDLLERVRSALEARDVNRLASHYHWTGTGSGSGKRLMDALERIASQPLVSADLIYPEPQPQPDDVEPMADGRAIPNYPDPMAAAGIPPRYARPTSDTGPASDDAPTMNDAPQPEARGPAHAPPHHLHVLQMRTDQAEQVTRTTFQLRRNAGCWWIEL